MREGTYTDFFKDIFEEKKKNTSRKYMGYYTHCVTHNVYAIARVK